MNQFRVRYYLCSHWSFFTQADHFDEAEFKNNYTLQQFAMYLNKHGFQNGKKWVMPGAIMSVTQI